MGTTTERSDDLLTFFKALADANRLKIVGLLAQGEYTVEELAPLLDLRASTVSHHLARLGDAGLVTARAESYYNIYQLNIATLEEMARRVLSHEELTAVASDVDLTAYDRSVLENCVGEDGRFSLLPKQQKKLDVLLRYMLQAFEADREYTEREVNEIIGRYHEDISGLRRDLINAEYLSRDRRGSAYWVS